LSRIESGRRVLRIEAEAILSLAERLGPEFDDAVEVLGGCAGKIVLTGMGKSGLVCRKIAATLTSTGTPAFFLHPAEGVHGDLGILTRGDAVVCLSRSGETQEVVDVLPVVRRLGLRLVAITGSAVSTLARRAAVHLTVSLEREACPLNLAPMAWSTGALALGDALAAAVMERKGVTADDFARVHPAGELGRRLTLRVEDLAHAGDRVPRVSPETPMREAILEMTTKRLGLTGVFEAGGALVGVITDGDLRRGLERWPDLLDRRAGEVMTRDPKRVSPRMLAVDALREMESHAVTALFVAPERSAEAVVGIVHMHDLVKAGLR